MRRIQNMLDFTQRANPKICSLEPYQPGKPRSELTRELGLTEIVKLASNENALGPSPKALNVIQSVLPQLNWYPDGRSYGLAQALCQKFNILENQLIIGNGSDNILGLLAQTFLAPNEEAIVAQYAFSTFAIVVTANHGNVIFIPSPNYQVDVAEILKAISNKTKLIFLANPNNPTGTWLNEKTLRNFLNHIPPEVIVVLDEAYYEYMHDPTYPDGILLQKEFPNIVVTRTFSKMYGLAGLRVGYGIAHPTIISLLNRVRLPFNVNSIAQAAALAALTDIKHIEKTQKFTQKGLTQLAQFCETHKISYLKPAGNFITIELPYFGPEVFQLLLKEGVIVRPLVPYGMPNHLRITTGLPHENAVFMKALLKVLQFLKI